MVTHTVRSGGEFPWGLSKETSSPGMCVVRDIILADLRSMEWNGERLETENIEEVSVICVEGDTCQREGTDGEGRERREQTSQRGGRRTPLSGLTKG